MPQKVLVAAGTVLVQVLQSFMEVIPVILLECLYSCSIALWFPFLLKTLVK